MYLPGGNTLHSLITSNELRLLFLFGPFVNAYLSKRKLFAK